MSNRTPAKRTFTYHEALDTFPSVRQSTTRAVRRIEALVNSLRSRQEMQERKTELEDACQTIVAEWVEEITIVGCEVKGLWLVDWDSGDGYYCWRYPEECLAHYHGYEEGFEGRVPIH